MPIYRVTVLDQPFITVVKAKNQRAAELKAFHEYQNTEFLNIEPEFEVEVIEGRYKKPPRRE